MRTSRFAPQRWLAMGISWLWFWLRRPWLAIIAGLIGFTLVLAVWQLPQLPGQYVGESAAAATWLLNASTAYGIWGNFFLALGLFDVLRSPLLYLLLALLLPTLAAQLADQLGALRQFRRVQKLELATAASDDTVIRLSAERPLYRTRSIYPHDPARVAQELAGQLHGNFPQIDQVYAAPPEASADTEQELRIRALRHPRVQLLRPLMMFGLLTAVVGAWIALAFGWQVTAPPLAPGSTYRSANRNLMIHYAVPLTSTGQTMLTASLQNNRVELPVGDAARQPLGAAILQVRPAYPGIWVTTADDASRLALPGDTATRAQIGLVFADPGSEESILIPDQGAGLRIVRRVGSDNFVLELYRSDAVMPIYRAELTPGGQLTIPFDATEPGLVVTAMPGLQVNVRHVPGLLLVPLGVLLALIGALAYLRDSAFVVAQVASWTPGHAVVIMQADHTDTLTKLRGGLDLSLPDATPAADDIAASAPSPPEA